MRLDPRNLERARHHPAQGALTRPASRLRLSALNFSPLVGSDLDVVLVVTGADLPFMRRAAAWDLTRLPVAADALVYTEEEWRRLEPTSRFARVLAREVVWVWPDEIV